MKKLLLAAFVLMACDSTPPPAYIPETARARRSVEDLGFKVIGVSCGGYDCRVRVEGREELLKLTCYYRALGCKFDDEPPAARNSGGGISVAVPVGGKNGPTVILH